MKILVAIDGSACSLAALDEAVALSGQLARPAALTLVNVHNDAFVRRHEHRFGKDAVDSFLAELHATDLAEATERLDVQGTPYAVLRLDGDPALTIARHAASGGFDLIVLGAMGRGAVSDVVLGSVVLKLLATSSVPLLVVTGPRTSPAPPRVD